MIKDAGRIGLWGASGSGKSTRAKAIMGRSKRKVIFDPLDEYSELGIKAVETIAELKQSIKGKSFSVAFVPAGGKEPLALHLVCKALWERQEAYKTGQIKTKLDFLIEELNLSYPVRGLSTSLSGMPNMCSRGRHYGVNVYGVSQRPAEVNTNFRGNMTESYCFRLAREDDARAVAGDMGSRKLVPDLLGLMPHEYLYRALDGKISKGKNRLSRA